MYIASQKNSQKLTTARFTFSFVVILVLIAAVVLAITPSRKHVHKIILIDETASFVPSYWKDSIAKASEIPLSLYAGDRLTIIGISDKAKSQDILFDSGALPAGSLASAETKSDLIDTIRNLQPQPGTSGYMIEHEQTKYPWGTDLLGAVSLAAHTIEPNEQVELIVFSDFEDAPTSNTVSTTRLFPNSTRFLGLNLPIPAGSKQYDQRISAWIPELKTLNITANQNDFVVSSLTDNVDLSH